MKANCGPSADGVTILLVEDNEIVRDSTTLWLEHLGYSVLSAADAPSALRLLDSAERVDLVLSDVVMPGGMTGQELAEEVRRRDSGVSVLLISGYPQEELVSSGKIGRDVTILCKPFPAAELERAIRRLLPAAGA